MIDGPLATLRADQILTEIGCLGSWEIDYAAERVRNTGQLPSIYGLTPSQAAESVSLSFTDRLLHPDDVDDVQRARKSPVAIQGGRRMVRFRIVDADGLIRWHESHGHVEVDRYGVPTRARGIVLDVTALKADDAIATAAPPVTALDDLSSNLLQAYRAARDLGLPTIQAELKPILTSVVHLLGRRLRQSSMH